MPKHGQSLGGWLVKLNWDLTGNGRLFSIEKRIETKKKSGRERKEKKTVSNAKGKSKRRRAPLESTGNE